MLGHTIRFYLFQGFTNGALFYLFVLFEVLPGAHFYLFWCAFLPFIEKDKKAHQKKFNSQKLPGALGPLGALGALFYPAQLFIIIFTSYT